MSASNTGRTIFKGGIVISMDRQVPNLARGDVLVDGGKISAVGVDLPSEGAQIIDATGCIVMPGLVDAHHHMWLGLMRRLMPDVDDLFAYIKVVAETLGAHYRPVDMFNSTKLTAAACLDAGITTVIDACHLQKSRTHGRRARRPRRKRYPGVAHGRRCDGQQGLCLSYPS